MVKSLAKRSVKRILQNRQKPASIRGRLSYKEQRLNERHIDPNGKPSDELKVLVQRVCMDKKPVAQWVVDITDLEKPRDTLNQHRLEYCIITHKRASNKDMIIFYFYKKNRSLGFFWDKLTVLAKWRKSRGDSVDLTRLSNAFESGDICSLLPSLVEEMDFYLPIAGLLYGYSVQSTLALGSKAQG